MRFLIKSFWKSSGFYAVTMPLCSYHMHSLSGVLQRSLHCTGVIALNNHYTVLVHGSNNICNVRNG
jgi:hypothetical protein